MAKFHNHRLPVRCLYDKVKPCYLLLSLFIQLSTCIHSNFSRKPMLHLAFALILCASVLGFRENLHCPSVWKTQVVSLSLTQRDNWIQGRCLACVSFLTLSSDTHCQIPGWRVSCLIAFWRACAMPWTCEYARSHLWTSLCQMIVYRAQGLPPWVLFILRSLKWVFQLDCWKISKDCLVNNQRGLNCAIHAPNVARLTSAPGKQINHQGLALRLKQLLKQCCACLVQLYIGKLFPVCHDGVKGYH